MKRIILLLILTSSPALASETKQEAIDREISQYLHSITKSEAEYEKVDNILGDTVLEGYACDVLRKGHITKRCKAELKEQAAEELAQ